MQLAHRNYTDVKQMMLRISTYEDTVQILDLLNRELITDGQNGEIKSMRQKVYDIRRRLKLVPTVGRENAIHVPQAITDVAKANNEPAKTITETIRWPIYAISYAHMSMIGAYGIFALCSGALIFIQSLEIYQRATFDHPILATCGALLLICAASIIRALKPGKITLMLCLYALSYESYLMVSGTLAAESVISSESAASDPRLQLAQIASTDALDAYEKAKATYDAKPNSWYKARFVDTAKAKYVASLEKLTPLNTSSSTANFSLLKILYRIGLLFLFSISVSLLISKIQNN